MVKCWSVSLLFADDTALLAGNAEDMKRSPQCLQAWHEGWSVKANVEKSAVMHMRKGGWIDVLTLSTNINKDEIPLVPTYKYLGYMARS